MEFNQMGLSPEMLQGIGELGFEVPTPIQEKVIPLLLNSENDVVGLAQTGTGKTAAFGLPIIQQISTDKENVQALILCPTRELCLQITRDFENFSKYIPSVKVVAVYGGSSIVQQMNSLRQKPQIVIGTPGRVLDLINRRSLKIKNIGWLVLDEADEMLDMGFKDELEAILEETPKTKRTLLFSATMPAEIQRISAGSMTNPVEISVGKRNSGAENVQHNYYVVHAKDKYEALKRIVDLNPRINGIVFCRTRQETKDVADKLMQDGYNADALHGDLSQPQRDYVMNRFRMKHLQLLVATDVAARGLDISDLTHVINYNIPDDLEIYIHRSGRTGRAGKSGISISIVHVRELQLIRQLEKLVNKKFERKLVPEGKEVCEKQLYNFIDKIEKVEVDEHQISPYLPAVYKKLAWLSREELIKHFVSVEFNRFLAYYKNSENLNVNVHDSKENRKSERKSNNFIKFQLNLGTKQRINPARLMGIVNELTRTKKVEFGRIEIQSRITFFEVVSTFENVVKKAFENAEFQGIPLFLKFVRSDTMRNEKVRNNKRN